MSDMEWEDTGPVLLRGSPVKYSAKATGSDLSSLEDSAEPVVNCGRRKGGCEVQQAGIDQPDDEERPWKRRRHSAEVHTSTVRVIYKNLTRESRRMLQAVLKQWSEWSGHGAATSEEELVENGDDLFFPGLEVGRSTKAVPVWIDRPLRKGGKEQALGGLSLSSSKEREAEIPLYNRICNPVSARDSPVRPEGWRWNIFRSLVVPRDPSRCFNCGSYSHALKDCPRPRDQAVINNARKQKAGASSGGRSVGRYFQASPGGKFEGIKPGILGKETRQSLGIGEWDPPPWLHRMRQLGYPPGYLVEEDDEDVPSGVVIFGGEENEGQQADSLEDGEIRTTSIPVQGSSPWKRSSSFSSSSKSSATKRMAVEYAGLNAPVPQMADKRRWEAQSMVQIAGTQKPPYLQHSASAPLPYSSDGTSPPGCMSPRLESPPHMHGGLPPGPPGGYVSPMSPLLPSPTREYSPIRTPSGYGPPVSSRSQYERYSTSHSLLATEKVPSPVLENIEWVRAQERYIPYNHRSRSADHQSR